MTNKEAKRLYDQRRYQELKEKQKRNKPLDPIALLPDTDLAYITGMVDGEGSITLLKNHICVQLSIQITMTHKETIDWLGEKLHVKPRTVKRNEQKPHWRQQYAVSIVGKRAALLCQRMLTYAITKRQQMEIGIAFGETLGQAAGPGLTVPQEFIEKRLALKREMHTANACTKYPHIRPHS